MRGQPPEHRRLRAGWQGIQLWRARRGKHLSAAAQRAQLRLQNRRRRRQGKVYSIEGGTAQHPNLRQATGYPGDPLGLYGYNCRHKIWLSLDGIPSQLEYDDEENARAYELSQQQRYLERNIREIKREVLAIDAAGGDSSRALAKLRGWQERYKTFNAQNGLKAFSDRTQVIGANNRSISRRAVVAASQKDSMNLQLFAVPKDVLKQNAASLNKSMKSLSKQIATHQVKISEPHKYVSDWGSLDERHKNGIIRHWEKEISTFRRQMGDIEKELERRGESK